MHATRLAVIVVEDDVAARAAIALLLRAERLRVAEVAGDARLARALLGHHRYGVALLDVHLGADSALGLAEILPRCGPDSPISLFSGNSGADVILEEAARLGARGFVMTCSDALVTGRTDIVEGRSFEHAFSPPPARPAVAPKRARLNPGEHAVLGLFAAGLTRPAIAQRLVLAPETVHTHIRTASAKLAATSGVQTVAALVRSRGADMPAGFVTA